MRQFSESEIETIKDFLAVLPIGDRKGITGANDDGILLAEYWSILEYGDSALECDTSILPWSALTNMTANATQN